MYCIMLSVFLFYIRILSHTFIPYAFSLPYFFVWDASPHMCLFPCVRRQSTHVFISLCETPVHTCVYFLVWDASPHMYLFPCVRRQSTHVFISLRETPVHTCIYFLVCLTRFFNGDFTSWTEHFFNISAKNQQIQPIIIFLIMYGSSYMFRHYIAILRERSYCRQRDVLFGSSR
jgi:hypothetical protein